MPPPLPRLLGTTSIRGETDLPEVTAPQCTAGKPGAPGPYKGRDGGLKWEGRRRSAVEGPGRRSLRGGEEAGRRGMGPRPAATDKW